MSCFTYCYPTCGLVLLSLVCRMTSVVFDRLGDIFPVMQTNNAVADEDIRKKIFFKEIYRWKHLYSLVSDCVATINKSMGPMIFAFTVAVFVSFVTNSFYTIVAIQALFNGLRSGYTFSAVTEIVVVCKGFCQLLVNITILTGAGTRLETSVSYGCCAWLNKMIIIILWYTVWRD